MKTQVNKSELFAQAWKIVKAQGVKIGEALKMVWAEVKEPIANMIDERRLATALMLKTSYNFRQEFRTHLFQSAFVSSWAAACDIVVSYTAWSKIGGMTTRQAECVANAIFKAITAGKVSRENVLGLRSFINAAYLQNN